MYVHLVIFLRANFAFHTSFHILLYSNYFNRLPFNSSFLLNLLALYIAVHILHIYLILCSLQVNPACQPG